MESRYKYQLTPRYSRPNGNYHDANPVYLHDDSDMLDAIFMSIDMACELGTDVLLHFFSPYVGWQYIHTAHPDGTATSASPATATNTGSR